MSTATNHASDHADPLDDTTTEHKEADDETHVRLPIDPSEPMASWLAII